MRPWMVLFLALLWVGSMHATAADLEPRAQPESIQAAEAEARVVFASLDFLSEGEFAVTPMFLWQAGRYIALPTGIEAADLHLTREDFQPNGDVDPRSGRVRTAKAASILNEVKSFQIFREGNEVGKFNVRGIEVRWHTGSAVKVIGRGSVIGYEATGMEVAVAGPTGHVPFWRHSTAPEAAKMEADRKMSKLLPASWPRDSDEATAGMAITYDHCREETIAVDLNVDGTPEVFASRSCTANWPPGRMTDAHAFAVAVYDQGSSSWRSGLSSAYLGEGQELFGGPHFTLMDVLDIDGDGEAEVVVRRAHGSGSGDLLVLGFERHQFRRLLELRGLWGS